MKDIIMKEIYLKTLCKMIHLRACKNVAMQVDRNYISMYTDWTLLYTMEFCDRPNPFIYNNFIQIIRLCLSLQ